MNKLTAFIALWMVAALTAAGQRFEVEAVEAAPFDMTAARHSRADLNGDACALVKFEIASPNARFQGSVVGEVRYDVGEYWVYAVAGTKELHVLHESLLPLKLYFPDYGIESLAGKCTYVVTLMLPNTQAAPVITSNKTRHVYPFRDEATGYWGLRNYMGEEIVEPRYEQVDVVKERNYIAVVENGKVGLVNNMGHMMLPPVYDFGMYPRKGYVAAGKGGRWGVVDYQNNTLVPFEYQKIETYSGFDDSLLGFCKNDLWALVSSDGFRPLTPFKYHMLDDMRVLFSNGMEEILNPDKPDIIAAVWDGRWGFLNADGTERIPATFSHEDGVWDTPHFINGYAAVCKDYDWGAIDLDGNTVVPFEYNSFYAQLNDEPNVYYISSTPKGEELWGADLRKITRRPYRSLVITGDSMVVYRENGMEGVVDLRTGNEVPGTFDEVYNYGLSEDRIIVKKGDKWGCIDRGGKQIFPFEYDVAEAYHCGFAQVIKDGKWGLIDKNGALVFPVRYREASFMGPDRLAVLENDEGQYSAVNVLGKTVVPFGRYSWISKYLQGDEKYWARPVKKGSLYGYINYRGQEIVPCEYSEDEAKRLLDVYLREHGHITD